MRIKTLTREAMIRNINGLSVGDKAYCGPYGVVECYQAATSTSARKFKVSGNENGKFANRGNYTMARLRESIEA